MQNTQLDKCRHNLLGRDVLSVDAVSDGRTHGRISKGLIVKVEYETLRRGQRIER